MSVLKKGINDLATVNPELAKEWHPLKNGSLTPCDVAVGTHKKVWWLGKCGHEWLGDVHNRAKGIGCPVCAGKLVIPGVNDLASKYPELAKEWHPTKNGELKPSQVTPFSGKKVWWLNSDGIEWESTIASRFANGKIVKNPGRKPRKGESLGEKCPFLVQEWHPNKNGDADIFSLNCGSEKRYWWICPRGHEYQSSPYDRSHGGGCPVCSKERSTSFPEQVMFFYLNKAFGAENRCKVAGKEVDIFIRSKNIGIEYDGERYHSSPQALKKEMEKDKTLIEHGVRIIRVKEGKKIGAVVVKDNSVGYNPKSNYKFLPTVISNLFAMIDSDVTINVDIERDLIEIYQSYLSVEKANSVKTKYPDIMLEWDYDRNRGLDPDFFSASSGKKVWWKCKKCGYQWQSSISHRTDGKGCPVCAGRVVIRGKNDLLSQNPTLASEWHPTKNQNGPETVSPRSGKYAWWICKEGHEWKAVIESRSKGAGCPFCDGRKLIKGVNDLQTIYPELAEEFDEASNGLKASDVFAGGAKKYWWKCKKCGHRWQACIHNRAVLGSGCHKCWRKTVSTKLSKKVMNCDTGAIFDSAAQAAKSVGSDSASNISACCRGKKETYRGFHWKYVD